MGRKEAGSKQGARRVWRQKAYQLGRYGHDPEIVSSCANVCGCGCACCECVVCVGKRHNQTEEHSRAANTILESVPLTVSSPFPPCTATLGPVAWWVPRLSFLLHSKAFLSVWACLSSPQLTTKVWEDEVKTLTRPSLDSHPPHPA